jgi:hypothetical protein
MIPHDRRNVQEKTTGMARTLPAVLLCIALDNRVNPRLFGNNFDPSFHPYIKYGHKEAPAAHCAQARHQNTDMLPMRCAHDKLEFLTSAGLNSQSENTILLFVLH